MQVLEHAKEPPVSIRKLDTVEEVLKASNVSIHVAGWMMFAVRWLDLFQL